MLHETNLEMNYIISICLSICILLNVYCMQGKSVRLNPKNLAYYWKALGCTLVMTHSFILETVEASFDSSYQFHYRIKFWSNSVFMGPRYRYLIVRPDWSKTTTWSKITPLYYQGYSTKWYERSVLYT